MEDNEFVMPNQEMADIVHHATDQAMRPIATALQLAPNLMETGVMATAIISRISWVLCCALYVQTTKDIPFEEFVGHVLKEAEAIIGEQKEITKSALDEAESLRGIWKQ